MTAQAIAAIAIGTGYLVSTLDGADQPDRALRVFTNAELRREVGYVEGTGDWNRQTATELKFDFRVLNPLQSVRPISKRDDTLHFGPDQAGWCMGVSANIEPLGRLVVEVVLRNNTPEERFILGGGVVGERPFDLVALGPAGETTLLGGARNVRSIGNWRIVARSIPAQSEAHWTLRFSESELKGGTGEYVIYGLVSIPRGRHVRKESNGEFTTLMRQESI